VPRARLGASIALVDGDVMTLIMSPRDQSEQRDKGETRALGRGSTAHRVRVLRGRLGGGVRAQEVLVRFTTEDGWERPMSCAASRHAIARKLLRRFNPDAARARKINRRIRGPTLGEILARIHAVEVRAPLAADRAPARRPYISTACAD